MGNDWNSSTERRDRLWMTTHCGCSGKDLLDLAIQTLKPKEFESHTPYFSTSFIISMGRNSAVCLWVTQDRWLHPTVTFPVASDRSLVWSWAPVVNGPWARRRIPDVSWSFGLVYEWLNQSMFQPGCWFGFSIIQVVVTKCFNSGLLDFLLFVLKMEKSQRHAGGVICQISPYTLAPFSLATPGEGRPAEIAAPGSQNRISRGTENWVIRYQPPSIHHPPLAPLHSQSHRERTHAENLLVPARFKPGTFMPRGHSAEDIHLTLNWHQMNAFLKKSSKLHNWLEELWNKQRSAARFNRASRTKARQSIIKNKCVHVGTERKWGRIPWNPACWVAAISYLSTVGLVNKVN